MDFKATASIAAEIVTAGRMHAGHLTAHAIDNMFEKDKEIKMNCPSCGYHWKQKI
jgi:redox-regulated HSP33 family molecular chaperone